MTRTILVVYTNKRMDSKILLNSPLYKKYVFLCKHDFIKVGDLIEDSRYTTLMQVVCVMNIAYEIYNGYRLKIISPNRVNGTRVNVVLRNWEEENQIIKESNKMVGQMESRNIKVSIEQAREWYNSGNSALKTLALNAFTEEELMMHFDYVFRQVETDVIALAIPNSSEDKARFAAKADLAIIAKYLNGDWSMRPGIRGWFIGNYSDSCGRAVVTYNKVGIYEHHTVQYEGITYFKSLKAAIKAVELLGDKVKLLFCQIDYILCCFRFAGEYSLYQQLMFHGLL